ncbi:MAG: AAA family ATPase, partial [Bacillati bacterium]
IACGANAPFRAEHVAALAGVTEVVILADSDKPGVCAAEVRAEAIQETYPDADVRIIDFFPDRDDGSDVADWLAEGHAVADLCALVTAAPRVGESASTVGTATGAGKHLDAQPTAVRDPALLSMGELLRSQAVEPAWLVEGLLPDGGTSLVVSKPKVGKSTLLQNLALCVARGEPFLGRATTQGCVVYVAIEDKPSELARAFRAMGARESDPVHFHCARTPDDAGTWLQLVVARYAPVLIVIDTFQRFAKLRDLNDYALVTNAFGALCDLARSCGAHLAASHHGKKAGGDDGDAVLGSTALFGAVDTLIELRRRDRERTVASIQRYGIDLEKTLLALDLETHLLSTDGTAAEADERRVSAAVIDVLRSADGPLTRDAVLGAVEGRRAVVIHALTDLVECGAALRDGGGRKGDPYLFALAAEGENAVPAFTDGDGGTEKNRERNKPNSDGVSSLVSDSVPPFPYIYPERENGISQGNEPSENRTLGLPFDTAAERESHAPRQRAAVASRACDNAPEFASGSASADSNPEPDGAAPWAL